MSDNKMAAKLRQMKALRTKSRRRGVYSEIAPELFARLEKRRIQNRKQRLELDSNCKIIEAGLEMILDQMDELDSEGGEK